MSQSGTAMHGSVLAVCCMLAVFSPFSSSSLWSTSWRADGAQSAGAPPGPPDVPSIERGRYIVEGIGVCWNCHTPRTGSGDLDRSRWLLGGPVVFEPPVPTPNWAQVVPRLAGLPPGTDEEFITLMMTGIARTGAPPRPPMPRFRMTRGDAASVLAYLKSLKPME